MIAFETSDLIAVLDCLMKWFLILLVALCVDLALRRSAATVRHLVWVLAMAAVLLCPLVSLFLPQVDLPLFAVGLGGMDASMDVGNMGLVEKAKSGISGTQVLIYGYALGVGLVLIWQLIGRVYASRLRRLSRPASDPELLGAFRQVMAELRTHGRVDLVQSDVAAIPFSTGFVRPAVVLPMTADAWPPEVLRTVLIHELGHVKRKDVVTRALAQLSCSLHWVNPIAWYGLRRVFIEQEIACDDLVLETGAKPSVYAKALLVLARAGGGKLSFAPAALGRRAELKDRLLEILKPKRSKVRLGTAGVLAGLCVALLFLAPLSALNLWEAAMAPAGAVVEKAAADPEKKAQEPSEKSIENSEGGKKADKKTTARSLDAPDLKKEVASIKKQIEKMKKSGASEKDIQVFSTESKKKLAALEKKFKETQAAQEAKAKTEAKNPEE